MVPRMPQPSLIQPVGYSPGSSCGYCSPPGQRSAKKESSSYGFWAHQLSSEFYDWLMNRGWRRSGQYVYHPDMGRTCCPQYTIRLEAQNFKPTKNQKRTLGRFNRLILTGSETWSPDRPHALVAPSKPGTGKYNTPFDLPTSIHFVEEEVILATPSPFPSPPPPLPSPPTAPTHKLRVYLHPSDPPHEAVHAIYQFYQAVIHQDPKAYAADSFQSFSRFLCVSPLSRDEVPYATAPSRRKERREWLSKKGLPETWGSWHQIYEIDGKVVAFGVLDIVPTGVSSVYFCYDPKGPFGNVKWGEISALREIALVRDMQAAGLADFKYEYLGFYVHSCTKMRYKGDYRPSELLDPATNRFHPLEPLFPHLEKFPRGAFAFADPRPPSVLWSTSESDSAESMAVDSDDDDEDEGEGAFPKPPPPSFLDPSDVSPADVKVMVPGRGFTTFSASPMRQLDANKQALRELVAALHGTGSEGEGVLCAKPSAKTGLVVVAL